MNVMLFVSLYSNRHDHKTRKNINLIVIKLLIENIINLIIIELLNEIVDEIYIDFINFFLNFILRFYITNKRRQFLNIL